MTLLDDLVDRGHTGLSIGGEWRAASDGETIEVLDPATGEPVATVASGSEGDALAAVDAAAAAASAWAATASGDRSEILRRAFELMAARADDFAGLIVSEMGKPRAEARGEALFAAEFFRWYSGEAVRNMGGLLTAPAGDKRILSVHEPIGVSLLITPWNFPASMAARKIAPAIAAGCTMVLKPASDTPLTALAVAATLREAGLPDGVLNVLPSKRSSAIAPLMLADDRVRFLSFTGSTEVGRILLAEASKTVVTTSMELGGNAPFLVFDDADVESAVAGAMIAKLRNGGQSCIAANRFLVHEAVAEEFATQLAAAMGAVTMGPGADPGVALGPLINRGAQHTMADSVEMSTGAGSSVRVGGSAPDSPGFFFEPTVLTGVDRGDPILGREIFGPIAPICTFASDEEAVALANDTIHGLAAYVYSQDLARAMRVSEEIETGMVGVNRGFFSDPAAPFGGVKQSGIGREGARDGMMEFLETKYIAVDW